jgi:excisionase family DNA binding protein
MMLETYLKVNDVARILKVTPHTVRMYIQDGRLEAVRLSKRGHWYVPESALLAALGGR